MISEKEVRSKFIGLDIIYAKSDLNRVMEYIEILEKNNLSKLVEKLFKSTKKDKFGDLLTEFNFCVQLIKNNNGLTIQYEPKSKDKERPVDFVIDLKEVKYFIQVKNESQGPGTTKTDKIDSEIERQYNLKKELFQGRAFNIKVFETYDKKDTSNLMQCILDHIELEDGRNFFLKEKAIIHFCPGSPGPYSLGGADPAEELSPKEKLDSLKKSAGAFSINCSDNTINLIVIETNELKPIELEDAVSDFFSTENKVACVVFIYPKNNNKLAIYYKSTLHMNPKYDALTEKINDLIKF